MARRRVWVYVPLEHQWVMQRPQSGRLEHDMQHHRLETRLTLLYHRSQPRSHHYLAAYSKQWSPGPRKALHRYSTAP
jgi:hypothetical protein